MSQQGLRQQSFRAIHGGAGGTYTFDAMEAMRVELEAASLPVPATHNGRMIAWLQLRLDTTDSNLGGLMAAFAAANGADKWSALGSFGANLLAETQTLLAAMSVEPDAERKVLYNNLYAALIDAGVLPKLDALHVIAAHDAQAARLNLVAPGTFDLSVDTGAPTFLADRHYATDGVDDGLTTAFNPAAGGSNFTQNSACFGIWSRTTAGQTNSSAGWFDGTDGISVRPRRADAFEYRVNQAAEDSGANADGSGFYVANRSAADATQGYKNGVAIATGTTASTALNSVTGLRLGRITLTAFQADQFAACVIGGSLVAQEQSDLYDALAAYMTAVGAA